MCSKWLFYIGFYTKAIIVQSQADQLLPQLFLEQFDNFDLQCRHIEHMHEGVWLIIPPAKVVKKPQLKHFSAEGAWRVSDRVLDSRSRGPMS